MGRSSGWVSPGSNTTRTNARSERPSTRSIFACEFGIRPYSARTRSAGLETYATSSTDDIRSSNRAMALTVAGSVTSPLTRTDIDPRSNVSSNRSRVGFSAVKA